MGRTRAEKRTVGHYDELTTARLTWVVLDRLVPTEDEAAARTALIARDPELRSLVSQGIMSEREALEAIRASQRRYGSTEGAVGDRLVLWAKRVAATSGASFLVWILIHVVR